MKHLTGMCTMSRETVPEAFIWTRSPLASQSTRVFASFAMAWTRPGRGTKYWAGAYIKCFGCFGSGVLVGLSGSLLGRRYLLSMAISKP